MDKKRCPLCGDYYGFAFSTHLLECEMMDKSPSPPVSYDKWSYARQAAAGGLNQLFKPCPCQMEGIDGTENHGPFSNLVFSISFEEMLEAGWVARNLVGTTARRYVYPCTNHWKVYSDNKWTFECVVVGKERFKIMPGTWIDKWEVKGSNGNLWTVSKKLDGTMGCSCPGWKFAKAPKKDCKHIRAITIAMNMGVVPQAKLKSNVTENRERVVRKRMETEGFYWGTPIPVKNLTGIRETEVEAKVDNEFFQVKRKFRLED